MHSQINPPIANRADLSELYELYPSLRNVECNVDHRLRVRRAVLKALPSNGIGCEIGVFTGMFSEVLAEVTVPRELVLVDPLDLLHGPTFPNWGKYTDFGRLETSAAKAAITNRIASFSCKASLFVSTSEIWASTINNNYFDWIYLDAKHKYDDVIRDLSLLLPKLKGRGVLAGDDAWRNPNSAHHSVFLAVNDFARRKGLDILHLDEYGQWAMRRRK